MGDNATTFIGKMKKWARLAPYPDNYKLDSSNLNRGLGCDRVEVLILDDKGRVFRFHSLHITEGSMSQIRHGKSELLKLIDELGIEDDDSPRITITEE